MIPRSDKIFPTATQANRNNSVVGSQTSLRSRWRDVRDLPSHYTSNLREK